MKTQSSTTTKIKTAIKNQLTEEESARLAELEPVIERGMAGFVEVGSALLEISERRLYRQECSTFKEYVETKWKMTARRAYQLCEAAEIVKSLPENVNHGSQINERQARELAKAPKEKRVKVLEAAQEKADQDGRPITAKDVKDAALEVCEAEQAPAVPTDMSEKLQSALGTSNPANYFAGLIEDNIGSACADGSLEQLQAIQHQFPNWEKQIRKAINQKEKESQ